MRHADIAADGQFMTQLYFEDDPGQNASTRLAMPTVRHEDPQELKARGLQRHTFFLTTEFDLTIATTTSHKEKWNN